MNANPDDILTHSVFWDLYCAAPERRDQCDHSSEAKAFHDYGFVSSGYNGLGHVSVYCCETTLHILKLALILLRVYKM